MKHVLVALAQLPTYRCAVVFRRPSSDVSVAQIVEAASEYRYIEKPVSTTNKPQATPPDRPAKINATQFSERYLPAPVADLYAGVRHLLKRIRTDLRAAMRVRSFCRKWKPDILYLNGLRGSELVIQFASWLHIPCVLHCHQFPRNNWFVRYLLRRVDKVLCISEAIRDRVQQLGCDQFMLVPNGIDLQRFVWPRNIGGARRQIRLPEKVRIAGVVGRIVSWKGQDDFIRAIAVLNAGGVDVTGAIIGKPDDTKQSGAFLQELHELADSLEIADKILWPGFHDDPAAIMGSLDVLVLSSSEPEPFGMVIIEGLAAGTPVVATAAGGALDIICDGENGLLIPPGDPGEMALAIGRILASPELAAKLEHGGRKTVTERFTIDRQIETIRESLSLIDAVSP